MKYVKIQVSDDFDPDTHTVEVYSPHLDADNAINKVVGEEVHVWQPQYRPMLDHGFIGLVDFMGDDHAITRSARTSYGKGTVKTSNDRGLIRYLTRHRHTSPIEFVEFTWHIKAPIFVLRQQIRHRTFVANEQSARYSEMTDEMYIPDSKDIKLQSIDNKQGRSLEELEENVTNAITLAITESLTASYETYKYLAPREQDKSTGDFLEPLITPENINVRKLFLQASAVNAVQKMREMHAVDPEAHPDLVIDDQTLSDKIEEFYTANEFSCLSDDFPGIARELARIVMPVAAYSEMYWKGNLKNLFHFIGLRDDPHAQMEIRCYASAMLEMIRPIVPLAVEAFLDYQHQGGHLSRMELDGLRSILKGFDGLEALYERILQNGATKRELTEFKKLLEL